MAIENLMTFDEIQRTALLGVIIAVPLMSGLACAWLVMVNPIVKGMRKHIADLQQTIDTLLAQRKNE